MFGAWSSAFPSTIFYASKLLMTQDRVFQTGLLVISLKRGTSEQGIGPSSFDVFV